MVLLAFVTALAAQPQVPPIIPDLPTRPAEQAQPPEAVQPPAAVENDLQADSRTQPVEFGDTLDVTVPRYPEFTKAYAVGRDGAIVVDIVGPLPVRGLTAPQVERLLTERLSQWLRQPQGISARIASRRMSVRVLGHVEEPGAKVLPKGASVQEAIAAARGLAVGAVMTRIVIRRQRDGWVEELPCDLKAFLEGRGRLPELAPGDEVFVPKMAIDGAFARPVTTDDIAAAMPAPKVLVLGAVRTPGELVLHEGVSLPAALAQAGGALETADLARVRRIPAGQGAPEPFDLAAWLTQGGRAPLLRAGDVVVVPSRETIGPVVRVSGAVAKPGPVQLMPGSDVQAALAAAGGALPAADLMRVQLHHRDGQQIVRDIIDLDRILREGNPAALVAVRDGDTVFVPRAAGVGAGGVATVHVFGAVQRPGAYPLSDTRSVLAALAMAGGPLPTADAERVAITRAPGVAGERLLSFDLRAYQSGRSETMPQLGDGDVVEVPSFEVTVTGEVVRPGTWPLRPGTNLVEALAAAGGPSPTADLGRVIVVRRVAAGQPAKREAVNLRLYLSQGDGQAAAPAAVPTLGAGDLISVEAMPADSRAVLVLGAVQRPGAISVADDGITLVSALAQAGGLLPTADRAAVRVLRVDQGRNELIALAPVLAGTATMPRVSHGDVVNVEETGRAGSGVLVLGSVTKQGWVSLGPGVQTVWDVIGAAGGIAPNAKISSVRWVHVGGKAETVDLTRYMRGQAAPVMAEGDVLVVGYNAQTRSVWERILELIPMVTWFVN
ncbi:MAG: SLBB domain-containing protein [Armatimonadetes bacterium]|nr:SLBB domain-containing protein [Armatimonadota bacterium]